MKKFHAECEKIIYIGNWENEATAKISKTDYGKFFLMFKGTRIKISATGELECSLDGANECCEKEFKVNDGVHTLFVTVKKGCCVDFVETDEIIDTELHLRELMNAEYDEIQKGREVNDPESWKKVEYIARVPEKDVRLKGMFGDLFQQNVSRIKACIKTPCYLVPNENKPDDKGWSEWLPAANDGRIIGGAAKVFAWTGDKELREFVDKMVDKVSDNMREDGFYGYSKEEESFAVNYIPNAENTREVILNSERKNYDRQFWTYGMIAAHKAGNRKALSLVRRMYDWMENSQYGPNMLLGHNATNAFMGTLVLAETAMGRDEDILFNQRFLDQKYWEHELINRNPVAFYKYPGDRPHCYALLGILALVHEYRLTGEKHYLDAALGGWDVYSKYYKHIGGTTAICEVDGPYPPGSYYMTSIGHVGETCGSVFWVWINHELSKLFPDDTKYAAEIEESLFNVLPSVIADNNGIRYHNRLQGIKQKGEKEGTCCELMSTFLLADLPEYVCIYNDDGIWLNQYISAEAKMSDISFAIDAEKLIQGKVAITIQQAPQTEKFFKLRIPLWAKNAQVCVNSKLIAKDKKSEYVEVNRIWTVGDIIEITYSLKKEFIRYTGCEQLEDHERHALFYGPYLMALTGEFDEDVPILDINSEKCDITEREDTFEITINERQKFVPYIKIRDDQKFCCFPAYKQSKIKTE